MSFSHFKVIELKQMLKKAGLKVSGKKADLIARLKTAGKKPTTKNCPLNKVVNPKTGRCIKIKTKTIKKCPSNKIVNPKTGRCIKIKPKTKKPVMEEKKSIRNVDFYLDKISKEICSNEEVLKDAYFPGENGIKLNMYTVPKYYLNMIKFVHPTRFFEVGPRSKLKIKNTNFEAIRYYPHTRLASALEVDKYTIFFFKKTLKRFDINLSKAEFMIEIMPMGIDSNDNWKHFCYKVTDFDRKKTIQSKIKLTKKMQKHLK